MNNWNRLTESILEYNHIKISLEKRFYLTFLRKVIETTIKKTDIYHYFHNLGFYENDPRFTTIFYNFRHLYSDERLTYEQFKKCIEHHSCIINKVLQRNLIIPNFINFCNNIHTIYEHTKDHSGGNISLDIYHNWPVLIPNNMEYQYVQLMGKDIILVIQILILLCNHVVNR